MTLKIYRIKFKISIAILNFIRYNGYCKENQTNGGKIWDKSISPQPTTSPK